MKKENKKWKDEQRLVKRLRAIESRKQAAMNVEEQDTSAFY